MTAQSFQCQGKDCEAQATHLMVCFLIRDGIYPSGERWNAPFPEEAFLSCKPCVDRIFEKYEKFHGIVAGVTSYGMHQCLDRWDEISLDAALKRYLGARYELTEYCDTLAFYYADYVHHMGSAGWLDKFERSEGQKDCNEDWLDQLEREGQKDTE